MARIYCKPIRGDEAQVRARCLRFLDDMPVRFEFMRGNNYWDGLGIGLDDLSTDALEKIALSHARRFWGQRRSHRESREHYAAYVAQQARAA